MNAVDTNVLIYHVDTRDAVKQAKAQAALGRLIAGQTETVLLWQVASEYLNQLRRWESQQIITLAELLRFFSDVRATYRMVPPTDAVLDRALSIADRYSLSHWDSMIVAACLEAGVMTLYTEDMGSPTKFDTLELVNPFA